MSIQDALWNMDRLRAVSYTPAMGDTVLHRTTIDIDVELFEAAKAALGTTGYRSTVNEALREVARMAALRRAAAAVRAGGLNLVSPEDIAVMRRPRV